MRYQDRTFESDAIERMESCDLFDYDAFVVTIKTQCRNYGKMNQQFCLKYPKMRLPNLGWGVSSEPELLPDGKFVIFTCLRPDQKGGRPYPPVKVYGCAASAIRLAAQAGPSEIALPLIGGSEKYARVPAMGQGIHDALALLEPRKLDIDIVIALGEGHHFRRSL